MRTSPGPADPLAALAEELGLIGRRLDGMGTELLALRSSSAAALSRQPGPGAPGPEQESAPRSQQEDVRTANEVAQHLDPVSDGVAYVGPAQVSPLPAAWPPAGRETWATPRAPYPAYPSGPYPPGPYPPVPYPGYGAQVGPPPGFGRPVAPAGRPKTSSAQSGARLLAWVGGAVTLLGVVMLLVLAASRGWFTVEARLVAGAVLGAALVGLGVWLHRRETARAGALALAATGFATLYLVTAAATAVYDYLPAAVALVIALLVAGAGLAVADRWRTQLLGAAVTGGAAFLAAFLAHDWLLVALALVLQSAAVPVVLRRRWPVLMLIAAAGPVLYGIPILSGYSKGQPGDQVLAIVLALAVLAVAVGTAAPAAHRLPVGAVGVLIGAASLPGMAVGAGLGGWGGAAVVIAAGLVMAGFAAWPGLDRRLRTVAAAAAALDLFYATATALDGRGATLTLVILAEAIVATVLAVSFPRGDHFGRFALVVGMVFGGFAVINALVQSAPLAALVRFPAAPYVVDGLTVTGRLVAGASVSALVLVLAAALLVAGGRVGWIRPDASAAGLWVPIGLVGLYGAAGVVVTLALLVSPDRAGFTAGHALVTVSWTVGALVLLARGISRPALRIAGLVLVAAAVAKLVLFDLVALDGLARVGAFLGAGLVLLAAGTRYTRLVAEAERDAAAEQVTGEHAVPPQG